jgi:hypothetical protein
MIYTIIKDFKINTEKVHGHLCDLIFTMEVYIPEGTSVVAMICTENDQTFKHRASSYSAVLCLSDTDEILLQSGHKYS